jgi:hypothetical protein
MKKEHKKALILLVILAVIILLFVTQGEFLSSSIFKQIAVDRANNWQLPDSGIYICSDLDLVIQIHTYPKHVSVTHAGEDPIPIYFGFDGVFWMDEGYGPTYDGSFHFRENKHVLVLEFLEAPPYAQKDTPYEFVCEGGK